MRQEKNEEALSHLREAARLKPGLHEAQHQLGLALLRSGETREAAGTLERALALAPDARTTGYYLSLALARQGKREEAIRRLAEALGAPAGDRAVPLRLVWALATSRDASLRDGRAAATIAEAECPAGERDIDCLDALAAAWAESGRFEEAVAAAREAIRRAAGDAGRAGAIRSRLALYEERRPYRE